MTKDIYKTCLTIDKVFEEKRWIKCFDLPIWFCHSEEHGAELPFKIIFPIDVYGHYQIYEKWIVNGDLSKEDFVKNFNNIIANYPAYFSKAESLVKRLKMIKTDLYYHSKYTE